MNIENTAQRLQKAESELKQLRKLLEKITLKIHHKAAPLTILESEILKTIMQKR